MPLTQQMLYDISRMEFIRIREKNISKTIRLLHEIGRRLIDLKVLN